MWETLRLLFGLPSQPCASWGRGLPCYSMPFLEGREGKAGGVSGSCVCSPVLLYFRDSVCVRHFFERRGAEKRQSKPCPSAAEKGSSEPAGPILREKERESSAWALAACAVLVMQMWTLGSCNSCERWGAPRAKSIIDPLINFYFFIFNYLYGRKLTILPNPKHDLAWATMI